MVCFWVFYLVTTPREPLSTIPRGIEITPTRRLIPKMYSPCSDVDWKSLLLVCSAIWSGTLQIAEIAGARASVVMVATKSPMMIARNLIIYVVISRYKLWLLINRSYIKIGGEIYEKC